MVLSRFQGEDRKKIHEVNDSFKGNVFWLVISLFKESYLITEYYESSNLTHLLIGDNTRTLKIIFALVSNAWILNSDYLDKSIKSGKWVEEEDYESEYYPTKGIRKAYGPLFKGMDFYIGFKRSEDRITNDMFVSIIELGGGEIVKFIDEADIVLTANSKPTKRKLAQIKSST